MPLEFCQVRCDRCGASWLAPSNLRPEIRKRIAELARENKLAMAMKFIREQTNMGLGDPKALVHHLCEKPETCHRCRNKLPEGEVVQCANCRALNFDW